MTFCVIIAALVALSVGSSLGIGSEHMTFAANKGINAAIANRGINVQTYRNQDQVCEAAGGTSGSTNACTATSTPGSMQTSVALNFRLCRGIDNNFNCSVPIAPNFCDHINCTTINCNFDFGGSGNCRTNNGVQLTSCIFTTGLITCTRTEPGTGTSSSGGVTGNDGG